MTQKRGTSDYLETKRRAEGFTAEFKLGTDGCFEVGQIRQTTFVNRLFDTTVEVRKPR